MIQSVCGGNTMEPIYTVEEVAERLKITPFAVRTLLRDGSIKGFKLGKFWRIKDSELEKFVNRLQAQTQDTRG